MPPSVGAIERDAVLSGPTLRGRRDGAAAGPRAREAARTPGTAPGTGALPAEEDLPPDPPEPGDLALEVSFVDAVSGAPFPTGFDLWRLAAPANADWTCGDQLQERRRDAGSSRARIERLPEGRYRIHAWDACGDSEDAPEFSLRGAGSRSLRIPVVAPRRFAVWLVVLDERGNRIQEGARTHGSEGRSYRRPPPPGWAHGRRLVRGSTPPEDQVLRGGGGSRDVAPRHASPVRAGPRGFDLGLHGEARRHTTTVSNSELAFSERTDVRVSVVSGEPRERTYVAVSHPVANVRCRVLCSDGRSTDALAAEVEIACEAVPVPEGEDLLAVARRLPLKVRVRLHGRRIADGELDPNDASSRFVFDLPPGP